MEHIGLIGQPNAGKTTLFNALTKEEHLVGVHPFTTSQTVSSVAFIDDFRLNKLAEMSKSKKKVATSVELVDIAGLTPGASKGEGLGNKFLGRLREVDALCFVLRNFEDESILGNSNPFEALMELELELILADSEAVTSMIRRREKAARSDKSELKIVESFREIEEILNKGTPLFKANLSKDMKESLEGAFLLTLKPFIVVINIAEGDIGLKLDEVDQIKEYITGHGEVLEVCAKLEMEVSKLEEGEKADMFEGLGLGKGATSRIAKAAHEILGLRTFFTTGDKESRAWTFREGSTAPICAGVIHSDLKRGFIRAEVINWEELLGFGSWHAAKTNGKIRVEGKDYVVRDGDVMEIRFNV